ncbi:lipocalin/fatty-acid binding family protein [Alteromonas macleodii]|uniref:Uncharacterized protein n=1 Tax=Alteromonas macleodii (strain English Channel 673) TaxID=1004788 RepID=A0AB33A2D0_ALTME|nr:lipocalin/fatty-acid binding family protein [Alteromonas macleodii]AFT75861.1 hypothetical protein AMEC673_15895 [Alteromonas macleodii str. 'English Channel 673']MBL3812152.1 hypothetical protein [Alteromonas macleodii]MBL3885711.1 hypothetical protein [Alteromonas macleodii]|tara:strand:+ start:488 stop:1210 length:723 start_codon:yes stop_codon:yes gene_type:complete
MKKRIVAASTAIVTIGCIFAFIDTAPSGKKEVAAANAETKPVGKENAVERQRNGKVLSTGVDNFKPKNEAELKAQATTTTNDKSEKDTIVWTTSEDGKKVLEAEGYIPADVTDEAYIELDREELMTVEVGEYLDLYIPQFGGSYTGEVDHVVTHPNGDRTVEAHIPGAGSLYAAVITLGENATYGNLATPRDVFVLEGNDKYAWIAPKSSMMQNHIEREPDSKRPLSDDNAEEVFDLGQN